MAGRKYVCVLLWRDIYLLHFLGFGWMDGWGEGRGGGKYAILWTSLALVSE